MNSIVNLIVESCLKNEYITEDQVPWLKYGLEKRFVKTIAIIPFLLFGVYLSSFSTAICFYLSFSFIRKRTSGFHARSFLACLVLSLLAEYVFLGVVLAVFSEQTILFLLIIAILIIFTLAPFRCTKIKLSDEEARVCAISSKIRAILIIAVYGTMKWTNYSKIANGIALGVVMAGALLAFAYIIQKGANYYDEK